MQVFLVITLYALFASVFTVGKWGLEYSTPLFLVGSRMTLAGLLMLAYLFLFKKDRFVVIASDWWKIIALGVCNIYLTNFLEFWGLKYLSSSKTCFMYSLSPFLAALFSYFMVSERMSLKKWIGLTLGFLGFMPILLHSAGEEETLSSFLYFSWAELAVFGAVVFSVFGWILLKQLCDNGRYSPVLVNGWSMLFGGLLALANSYAYEVWQPFPVTEYFSFGISCAVLIIVSNFICYNLYGYLLRYYSATFMSFAGFVTPLFAALFGWLFLGESINWYFISSFVIVFFGLVIFHQEELAKERILA